jgi:hypothetical protein
MPSSMYKNRGRRVVAVITACSIVVTVIVGLRFYVRFGIIKSSGLMIGFWLLFWYVILFLSQATHLKVIFQVTTVFSATLLAAGK